MNPVERAVRGIDEFQQRRPVPAFVFGVIRKFGDDRGSALCALMTYYSFVAIFPLLLLLATGLGYALAGHPGWQVRVVHSAVAEFPVVGNQLAGNVHSLRGRGLGVVVGAVGLLYGSLGFAQTGQLVMAEVWNVPGVSRPNFLSRLLRSLLLVGLLGLLLIATTALSVLGAAAGHGPLIAAAWLAAGTALNVALFVAAFRILTPPVIPMADLWPGACLAGAGWEALQIFGGYLLAHQLRHTSQVYGVFAFVLGLVWFLYLGSEIVMYSAEVNVVHRRRLWPRSIVQPPLTPADRRVLVDVARAGERRPEERVSVEFVDDPAPPVSSTPA